MRLFVRTIWLSRQPNLYQLSGKTLIYSEMVLMLQEESGCNSAHELGWNTCQQATKRHGDASIWDTPQKCHFTLGFYMLNFLIVGCPWGATCLSYWPLRVQIPFFPSVLLCTTMTQSCMMQCLHKLASASLFVLCQQSMSGLGDEGAESKFSIISYYKRNDVNGKCCFV